MKRFIALLQFMTRIPINIDVGFDEEFHKSITYFPLVGFVLGVLLFLIGTICGYIFDPFVTAIIITLSSVVLTGGLHIDGLGDTFDALYSYRDKEKMLEIMKDSRLGTNSLLAVMFVILLKVGFIYSIVNNGYMWLVMFMPVIGRLGVIRLTYKTVSPRAKGMGNMFIGKLTTGMFLTAIVYTIVLITLIAKFIFLTPFEIIIKVLLSIVLVFLFNQLFKGHVYKKIDGVTGDILGCSIELGEVIYLLYIYLIIG